MTDKQVDIIRRILHIMDLKFSLLTMSLSFNQNSDLYQKQCNENNGIPFHLYEILKVSEQEINKQIQLIESDTKELFEIVKS